MTDAPSLYPEPVEVAAPPGKGLHGYYRRGDNGWVVMASTTPSNRSDYEYKGFTFMPQYGQFKNGTNEPRAKRYAADDRGTPWNPATEPWRLIFQRGGAKEFPVDQIIAFRWHLRPPYKEVTFPQLEGVTITNYPCPECDKGIFSSTNSREAGEQLRAHLTSGINGRHGYTPTDLRELGHELEIDFDSSRVGRVREVKMQMAASLDAPGQPPEMKTTAQLTCEEEGCGYLTPEGSKNPADTLQRHGNQKHKEPVLA